MPDRDGDLSGTLLGGRYRLRRRIGEGGMGAVYEAWQEDLRRLCAIKVIAGQKPDEASVARFQKEARAAAALGHPHIVQIYDFQVPEGGREPPYLVMELLPGPSLAELLQTQGAMQPERVARIARHVLDALGAAHVAGVIHRDIKPANIAVVPSSTLGEIAKVLDFGLAKLAESTTGPMSSAGLLGTITYMSPEQAAGLEVDGRTDVYAVAVCMYVACTLRRPFEAPTPDETLRALFAGRCPPLASLRGDLDAAFVAIVERGMATDRHARYASAYIMAADLDAWLAQRISQLPATPRGPSARPPSMPGIGAYIGSSVTPGALGAAPNHPHDRSVTLDQQSLHGTSASNPHRHGARSRRSNHGMLALVMGLLVALLFVGGGAATLLLVRPDVFRAGAPPASDAGPHDAAR